MPAPTLPTPGQIAKVRQRLYLVEETTEGKADESPLVELSCVDDDAQGQPLAVLWDKELDAEILSAEAWEKIAEKGFDPPNLFAAYLNTLRWNCVTSTDPKLFQSPFRAGIKLDAYQLEPLRKALVLPRVNLFIADDVGLGKTIEAGLIARELLLRKKIRDIIVACPPSMLLQWQEELDNRFGLRFEILDRDYVKQVRRERGFGINPWSTHSRLLVSHKLLIDEAYAGPLRDHLGEMRAGSLLILDEAHHAAPSSGQRYAIDSQITKAVRDLARRFEHRLFLSATPHNGHSNSFSALLEILDPQRFCRGVPVQPKMLEAVMVRRLKEDLREIQGGFPKRVVGQIDIDGLPEDAPELKLVALLDKYGRLRERRLKGESKRTQAAAGLLICGLQQRLLSSIEAFARTLRVHRRTVERQWLEAQSAKKSSPVEEPTPSPVQLDLLFASVGSDDERADLNEDALAAEEDAQVEAASAATAAKPTASDLFNQERKLLDEMTELAEEARGKPDARVRRLIEWMRKNMCPGVGKSASGMSAKWNNTRVIIFTEWDDTRRYLHSLLSAAIEGTDQANHRIAVYYGPTPAEERERIKRAFNADPAKHPVRILIATDAAREGLNLQAHCANLFHFDVPWNPARLEQRNGRIDRKLQPASEVFCHYFVYRQRPEDRVLSALVRKTERIKQELGSLSQVVEARLTKSLERGIRRDSADSLANEIEAADLDSDAKTTMAAELESARIRQDALRAEIDALRTRLKDSQDTIGLKEEQFRSAISCGLELLRATKLEKQKADDDGPDRWSFPALDQREGADPTWIETLDALRSPRPRDQKLWDWRRSTPIRPVVFEDVGRVDEEVVHLHLEHRVVRRLLARFSSQGFVFHDLSRACLTQTKDAIPRVVLLGRLCLYGASAARLHEELVPVTARWNDTKVRDSKLIPYQREAESKTLALLDDAITGASKAKLPAKIREQLQASAPRDVSELLPHLEARGKEHAESAKKLLAQRGDAESRDMRLILEQQRKHIQTTAAKRDKEDPRQGRLAFADEEIRQLEADKRYWVKRLDAIEGELETEPERIREVYEVVAQRIEPIGLVYLWPVTG